MRPIRPLWGHRLLFVFIHVALSTWVVPEVHATSSNDCVPAVLSAVTKVHAARPASAEELKLIAELDSQEIFANGKMTEHEVLKAYGTFNAPQILLVPAPGNPGEKIIIFRKRVNANTVLAMGKGRERFILQPHSEMLAKILSENLGFRNKIPETFTKTGKVFGQDSVVVYQEYIPNSTSLREQILEESAEINLKPGVKKPVIMKKFRRSSDGNDAIYLKYIFGNVDLNRGNVLQNSLNHTTTLVDHERILLLKQKEKFLTSEQLKQKYQNQNFPLWSDKKDSYFYDSVHNNNATAFIPSDSGAQKLFFKIKNELSKSESSAVLDAIIQNTLKQMQARGLSSEELFQTEKQLVIFETRMRSLVRKILKKETP